MVTGDAAWRCYSWFAGIVLQSRAVGRPLGNVEVLTADAFFRGMGGKGAVWIGFEAAASGRRRRAVLLGL